MTRLIPLLAAAALALGACAGMEDTAVNPPPLATGANLSDDSSAARITNETSTTSGAHDPNAGRGTGGSGGSTGGGATGVTGTAPPSSTP